MFPLLKVSIFSLLRDFKDLWIALVAAIVFYPFAILLFIVNISARYFVSLVYKHHYSGRYTLANGQDSTFGCEIPGTSKSTISGFKIFKGTPNLKLIQQKFDDMLKGKSKYEKLKYALTNKLGYFCWDVFTAGTFDVRNHVKMMDAWSPEEIVDEKRLIGYLEKNATVSMSSSKPQWEMLFIPKYRVGREQQIEHYALAIRLNHAYCDGISYILMTNNELTDVSFYSFWGL